MTRRMARPHSHGVHLLALCSFLLACAASVADTAFPESVASDATPERIVARLQAAESEALLTALQAQGEAAIPAIAAGLAQGDEAFRVTLARALGGIGGDASTSLLVGLLAEGPSSSAAMRALAALQNRPVRRPLSAQELRTLVALVREANSIGAGSAARVLARCERVPARRRLASIIERFEAEVVSPVSPASSWPGYLSPEVSALNQFLLALSYIGRPAVTPLQQALRRAAGQADLEQWLTLALGMAGDKAVATRLKEVVLGEADRYVRCVAVRAYARSAQSDAIPLLESLLDDDTESEYTSCTGGKVLLIRNAASDELARLRK